MGDSVGKKKNEVEEDTIDASRKSTHGTKAQNGRWGRGMTGGLKEKDKLTERTTGSNGTEL